MRTRDEVKAEADLIQENIRELEKHFWDVQTWPNGERKVAEWMKIAKTLQIATNRMQELTLEIMAIDLATRASKEDEKPSGNNFDFIN